MKTKVFSFKNVTIDANFQCDLAAFPVLKDNRSKFFYKLIRENAVAIVDVENDTEFRDEFLLEMRRCAGAKPKVFLDISSISGEDMARLFSLIFSVAETQEFDLVIGYVVAEFTPPPEELPPNNDICPVSENFAGWPSFPSARTSLIVGLGYEREKAEGACEYFDSNEIHVFVPTSPIVEYEASVRNNNSQLLAEATRNKLDYVYSLDNPERAFGQLVAVVADLISRSNPVILPFGPKLFFALSLIVAEIYKEVGVWHVTGELVTSAGSFNPSGCAIGFEMRLGPSQA